MRYPLALLPLLLCGCAVNAGLVHISQPAAGIGPYPIGDNGRTAETNLDGIELSVRWESERAYAESSMAYALQSEGVRGGPWLFTARVGVRVWGQK